MPVCNGPCRKSWGREPDRSLRIPGGVRAGVGAGGFGSEPHGPGWGLGARRPWPGARPVAGLLERQGHALCARAFQCGRRALARWLGPDRLAGAWHLGVAPRLAGPGRAGRGDLAHGGAPRCQRAGAHSASARARHRKPSGALWRGGPGRVFRRRKKPAQQLRRALGPVAGFATAVAP